MSVQQSSTTTMKTCLFIGAMLIVTLMSCLAEASKYESYATQEYPIHYSPYSFGYDVDDGYGNKNWRSEKSVHPHEVHGSYGYTDKNGIYREVYYVADKNGFRAHVKTNEPGTEAKDPAYVRMQASPVQASYHVPSYSPPAKVYSAYSAPTY
ncbi:hypothetical protein GZH46_02180 [Fragariocoptes setiger]|uniref:Uncharacterized protein n=1 Tax=Fragariocoptes setiger TaxID=1670756 RepID=A0ABQ7S7G1_9ACAR|nr:hypothetical protein GZH46_02180 [Fragariocoptes setiger]